MNRKCMCYYPEVVDLSERSGKCNIFVTIMQEMDVFKQECKEGSTFLYIGTQQTMGYNRCMVITPNSHPCASISVRIWSRFQKLTKRHCKSLGLLRME